MEATSGIWGAVALAIATLGSVMVAKVSRPQKDALLPTAAELNTIAGLAQEMIRLTTRVSDLEAEQAIRDTTNSALWRYILLLKAAVREAGGRVPDPDPADAVYLRTPE